MAARPRSSSAMRSWLASACRVVRDLVTAARQRELVVKGKTEPVEAWSVLEIAPEPVVARRLESPLIGREAELAAVEAAFAHARNGSCQLLTVMGPAGVG